MELNDWMLILVVCGFFSGVFTILGVVISTMIRDYRVSRLEQRADELSGRLANAGLNSARRDKAEEMELAMAEAITAVQSGKDIKEVLKETAMKHPNIALSLVKKGLKI